MIPKPHTKNKSPPTRAAIFSCLSLVISDRVAVVRRAAYQNNFCSPGIGAGVSTSTKNHPLSGQENEWLCNLGTRWHCLQGYYLYYSQLFANHLLLKSRLFLISSSNVTGRKPLISTPAFKIRSRFAMSGK